MNIKCILLKMQKPPQFKIFLPHLVPPNRIIRSPTIQQHCLLRGHGPFPLGSTLVQTKDSAVWTDKKKKDMFILYAWKENKSMHIIYNFTFMRYKNMGKK